MYRLRCSNIDIAKEILLALTRHLINTELHKYTPHLNLFIELFSLII